MVAKSCRSDAKPVEIVRTKNVEVRIVIFPRKMRISGFTVKVPVYDEGYELVCAILPLQPRRNKHFACGAAKFSAKDLLHGSGGTDEDTSNRRPRNN